MNRKASAKTLVGHPKATVIALGFLTAVVTALAIIHTPVATSGDTNALGLFCTLLLGLTTAAVFASAPEITNLTTWWTWLLLMQFGFAPLACLFYGRDEIDMNSVVALGLMGLGILGFWAGAKLVAAPRRATRFLRPAPAAQQKRLLLSLITFAIGVACKFYIFKQGLFSYIASPEKVDVSLKFLQWLIVLSNFTIISQIILTVDYFQARSSRLVQYAFFAATTVNLAFAILSGMKAEILIIPFLIFLIQRQVLGKFQWKMITVTLLLFVILIPLNSFYRDEVHSEGPISTLSSGQGALGRALDSVDEYSRQDFINSALQGAAFRLNLLPVIVFIDRSPDLDSLRGSERLWMIPFYPFVPRFLWKDKPILDKGRRLSFLMSGVETSSTAVTPFGDLLVLGGMGALLLGSVLVGAAIQTVTNLVSADFGAGALFLYVMMFLKLYSPEYDIMLLGTTMIQTFTIAILASYFIYSDPISRFGLPEMWASISRFVGLQQRRSPTKLWAR